MVRIAATKPLPYTGDDGNTSLKPERLSRTLRGDFAYKADSGDSLWGLTRLLVGQVNADIVAAVAAKSKIEPSAQLKVGQNIVVPASLVPATKQRELYALIDSADVDESTKNERPQWRDERPLPVPERGPVPRSETRPNYPPAPTSNTDRYSPAPPLPYEPAMPPRHFTSLQTASRAWQRLAPQQFPSEYPQSFGTRFGEAIAFYESTLANHRDASNGPFGILEAPDTLGRRLTNTVSVPLPSGNTWSNPDALGYCGRFANALYADLGVKLSEVSSAGLSSSVANARGGKLVDRLDLEPGMLIFFPGHVEIVVDRVLDTQGNLLGYNTLGGNTSGVFPPMQWTGTGWTKGYRPESIATESVNGVFFKYRALSNGLNILGGGFPPAQRTVNRS